MAVTATIMAENAKGRNVEPLSSILDIQTADADCSGLTNLPLDGEFIIFSGRGEPVGTGQGFPDVSTGNALTDNAGARLAMVWSERDRSDLSSTGHTRVPVIFRKSFHCKLALYNRNAGDEPESGDLLYVAGNHLQVGGVGGTDDERLIASYSTAVVQDAWCVGYILKGATGGDPIEVVLYDQPRKTAT